MQFVFYHRGCADGLTSAIIAYKVFGDNAVYLGQAYGEEISTRFQPGDDVMLVDFSMPREWIYLHRHHGANITVIDHHESAQKALEGVEDVIFDMNHSGAYLTWKYFFPDLEVPLFVQYVEDRDIWNWGLQNSTEINAGIESYPKTFETWKTLFDRPVDEFISEGKVVLRQRDSYVDYIVRTARWMMIAGYWVPVVNTSTYISDVGNRLVTMHTDAPFAATYYDAVDGRRWSLRSIKGSDVNLSEVAGILGGGGHPSASGFRTDIPETPEIIKSNRRAHKLHK